MVRAAVAALLALTLSCSAPAPIAAPAIAASPAAPPAPPAPPARACADDPDSDGDGIPDRCDACPHEPGTLWDDFPIIDGCTSGALHSLVREPQGLDIRASYARNAVVVDPAGIVEVARALGEWPADAVACVGVRAAAEHGGEALARRRAGKMIDALALRLPGVRFVAYATVGDAPAVDVAVLSRGGREELRWLGDHFEHVGAAAVRARRAEAMGKPSPCGRRPGERPSPPPCEPPLP